MIKKCFIDVETTGTDPKLNGIWQIAGLIQCTNKLGVDEEHEFNFTCSPFEKDQLNPTALTVGGVTAEQIYAFARPNLVKLEFCSMLERYISKYDKKDKFFFIGYNATFDMDFLREWFAKTGDRYFGSYFWYPPIDVMVLAGDKLMYQRAEMENFKLHTVAKACNIEVDSACLHAAAYDIWLTQQIYKFTG